MKMTIKKQDKKKKQNKTNSRCDGLSLWYCTILWFYYYIGSTSNHISEYLLLYNLYLLTNKQTNKKYKMMSTFPPAPYPLCNYIFLCVSCRLTTKYISLSTTYVPTIYLTLRYIPWSFTSLEFFFIRKNCDRNKEIHSDWKKQYVFSAAYFFPISYDN